METKSYTDRATKGYIAYVEKFGIESLLKTWNTLPWQAMPAAGAYLPFSIEDDERIGRLLGECERKNMKVTARQTVDVMYLRDGIYHAPDHGVKAKSYDEFLTKMSKLRFYT